MSEVIEVNDFDALESYRLAWDALLPETPRASYFHTYDWLATYWRHFGQDQRLRVLIARAAGKTIGIVPLVVRSERHRLGSERVLTFPLEDWGMWYGPIGRNTAATWLLAARHIASSRRDWDTIRLRWIDAEASQQNRVRHALQMAGMTTRSNDYQRTAFIEVAGSWDDYLKQLKGKTRHELRRTLRRTEEMPEAEYVRHRPLPARDGDGDPRWDLYDACHEIAEASWQADSTDGNTLCHPQVADFYRDAHATAARLGMVDINLLRIAGRPAAFCYNYHYLGRVFGLRMGFNRDIAPSGAGRATVLMMLRDSFARGDSLIEMGIGERRYKSELRSGVAASAEITHIAPLAWRSRAIDWSHRARRRLGQSRRLANTN